MRLRLGNEPGKPKAAPTTPNERPERLSESFLGPWRLDAALGELAQAEVALQEFRDGNDGEATERNGLLARASVGRTGRRPSGQA